MVTFHKIDHLMQPDKARHEAARARHEAARALGLLTDYFPSWRVTTRASEDGQAFSALDIGAAIRVAVADKPHAIDDENVEGDEVLFMDAYDSKGLPMNLDIEIDARQPGEPFSWTACEIIKHMAAAGPGDDLTKFLVAAREACHVVPIEEQIAAIEKQLEEENEQ